MQGLSKKKPMSDLGVGTGLVKKGTADGLGDGTTCKACPRKKQGVILGRGPDLEKRELLTALGMG